MFHYRVFLRLYQGMPREESGASAGWIKEWVGAIMMGVRDV